MKYIIGVLISVCFMASCTQEDILNTNEEYNDNQTGYVTLNFNTPSILNATVSRATNEDREDFLVNDLYIYVFHAETGELLTMNGETKNQPAYLEGKALTNGTSGEQSNGTHPVQGRYSSCWVRFKVDSNAFNQDVYIYLIANTKGYTNILSTQKPFESIKNKTELDELICTYQSFNPNREYILMSSNADYTQGNNDSRDYDAANVNAVKFHITETGNIVRIDPETGNIVRANSETESLITLQRTEARIKFTFKSGNNGTFKPETYRIHNFPLKSNMICKYVLESNFDHCAKVAIKTNASQDPINDFTTTEAIDIDDSNAFTFYMPENLRIPGGENGGQMVNGNVIESTESLAGYKLREKRNADESWENAPTVATYVEVTGTYTENGKEKGTKVTYFIHPGFSSNSIGRTYYVNDYIVRRNYEYTYNITVNGIQNIGTKVVEE